MKGIFGNKEQKVEQIPPKKERKSEENGELEQIGTNPFCRPQTPSADPKLGALSPESEKLFKKGEDGQKNSDIP